MCVNGMSETLRCGFHWGAIKRRSYTWWYMTIGGGENVRLWSRLAVMLYRGETLGIPLLTRCVAICYAVRVWLRLRLFSVLTRLTEGSRAYFWGYFPLGRGGFVNTRFP